MKQFLKANMASLIATGCDYSVTVALKELAAVQPVAASITGTVVGGITNFLICRHWVFKDAGLTAFQQGKRYLLTWAGNLLLNVWGVYALIELAGWNYIVAKILTSITVAVAYNYPLQKRYVFKK
ncbi:MAG: GtrA family protein [Ferruginibacter sp.]